MDVIEKTGLPTPFMTVSSTPDLLISSSPALEDPVDLRSLALSGAFSTVAEP